jgi:hypothetical protein
LAGDVAVLLEQQGRWKNGDAAMIAKWLSNLKWFLLIAIVAGPGWAYYSWTGLEAVKRVAAQGTEATAFVDGGESRSGRRSGTSYSIHAIWPGEGGVERAENISISSEYAKGIVQDDMLLIDEVQIKYMPGDDAAPVLVVDDIPQQQADKELMIWLGIGAGVIGVIGSAIFFLAGRRKA